MALTYKGDMAYLPQEIFQMIIQHLEPVDLVRCRRVSSSWYRAFTNPVSLAQVLKVTFPLAKEVRELVGQIKGPIPYDTIYNDPPEKWRLIFDRVTERYYRLTNGIPRSVQTIDFQDTRTAPGEDGYFSVPHWNSHSSHPGSFIDMLFEPVFWTYNEGLVVYPDERGRCLMLLDVETEEQFMVPFVTIDKVIRRMRLHDRLLVIEWAESETFHWLNDQDSVHRHFATSFEVNAVGRGWDIVFRNEWKIMFLGHPLGERDRFFSCHSRSHYAIYTWQPNRSLYTADEDAPIESLSIWDISAASGYRPSQDPTGRPKDNGPRQVASFAFRDLEFYSVRQRGLPAIMRMDIDSDSNSISITEVRDNAHMDFNVLEYAPWTRIITIPFIGQGPAWQREVQTRMEIAPWTVTKPWPCYCAICESIDEKAQVSFCISYASSKVQAGFDKTLLLLTIHTPHGIRTLPQEFSQQLSYTGKICGDERFVIGENDLNQLVVMKF
ncbi:F-box domain protein [Talaromyces stipitatus ATCC 10500]|uniref:F-box domain protein n=1 Tax=Talaromyces stipitatus (strain ATCC 10500 / CBS 375.48 / QM 6759 / NRRL 1006) TaxID=441959 RepID=B8MH65_TALSN|nr:F-box domain protein [Talaromyces stipitatus ATCC 10500]EED16879.1 F-box domain protein [Talaromyces stipitatus ATCC 10500]